MMTVTEVKLWLDTLYPDSSVAIDDGGLKLVEIEAISGEQTESYLEIGGIPVEDKPATMHFAYSRWRHGGWYTNVRYPSGACGCVSRNYKDRKWRIACDPRPFEQQPTFKNRDAAALAEWRLINETPHLLSDYEKGQG